MVEAAAATFVAGWLTPTSLFILLNIVVGTILISSAFGNNNHQNKNTSHNNNNNGHSNNNNDQIHQYPPQLARAPSLFSRVTSFNFSNNYHYDPQPHQPDHDTAQPNHQHITKAPSLLSRVTSFCRTNEPYPTYPVQPESKPVVAEAPVVARAPSLLSRVASFGLYRPEPAQPVTVSHPPLPRAEESTKPKVKPKAAAKKPKMVKKKDVVGTSGDEKVTVKDEGVDTKADDFINKFKQQLKLQRIESLMRYRSSTAS